MKNILTKSLIIIALIITACEGVDKKPVPETYKELIGNWNSNNGISIEINADGSGSVKKVNSKSVNAEIGGLKTNWNGNFARSISGGAVTITTNKLKITLLTIETSFEIDKFPYEEGGNLKIELDGNVYIKEQGLED